MSSKVGVANSFSFSSSISPSISSSNSANQSTGSICEISRRVLTSTSVQCSTSLPSPGFDANAIVMGIFYLDELHAQQSTCNTDQPLSSGVNQDTELGLGNHEQVLESFEEFYLKFDQQNTLVETIDEVEVLENFDKEKKEEVFSQDYELPIDSPLSYASDETTSLETNASEIKDVSVQQEIFVNPTQPCNVNNRKSWTLFFGPTLLAASGNEPPFSINNFDSGCVTIQSGQPPSILATIPENNTEIPQARIAYPHETRKITVTIFNKELPLYDKYPCDFVKITIMCDYEGITEKEMQRKFRERYPDVNYGTPICSQLNIDKKFTIINLKLNVTKGNLTNIDTAHFKGTNSFKIEFFRGENLLYGVRSPSVEPVSKQRSKRKSDVDAMKNIMENKRRKIPIKV